MLYLAHRREIAMDNNNTDSQLRRLKNKKIQMYKRINMSIDNDDLSKFVKELDEAIDNNPNPKLKEESNKFNNKAKKIFNVYDFLRFYIDYWHINEHRFLYDLIYVYMNMKELYGNKEKINILNLPADIDEETILRNYRKLGKRVIKSEKSEKLVESKKELKELYYFTFREDSMIVEEKMGNRKKRYLYSSHPGLMVALLSDWEYLSKFFLIRAVKSGKERHYHDVETHYKVYQAFLYNIENMEKTPYYLSKELADYYCGYNIVVDIFSGCSKLFEYFNAYKSDNSPEIKNEELLMIIEHECIYMAEKDYMFSFLKKYDAYTIDFYCILSAYLRAICSIDNPILRKLYATNLGLTFSKLYEEIKMDKNNAMSNREHIRETILISLKYHFFNCWKPAVDGGIQAIFSNVLVLLKAVQMFIANHKDENSNDFLADIAQYIESGLVHYEETGKENLFSEDELFEKVIFQDYSYSDKEYDIEQDERSSKLRGNKNDRGKYKELYDFLATLFIFNTSPRSRVEELVKLQRITNDKE